MEKEQIISFIEGQIAAGKISRSDLTTLGQGSVPGPLTAPVKIEDSSKKLINIFYAIGAVIAIVGVIILIAQHWDEIGFLGRILFTLGISLVVYILALVLNQPQHKTVSQVLFTISAALAPLGAYVFLNEAKMSFDWVAQISTASILFVVFGTALLISKKNILVLITVGFATWAYYAVLMKVFGLSYYNTDFLKWATMLLGAAYLLIAYGQKAVVNEFAESDLKEKKAVQSIIYTLGTLAVLGAGISVGGVFDMVFIAIIFGAFYGSAYLKNRTMLILGALFLTAHIMKLTSEYFVGSIGWPIALIFMGFLVIGIGYMTYYLNNKFISSK
jgi:hypothetical protein